MLARGITVSLGTDGKSSNDSQDMYEVLKTVALLHKTQQPEFDTWLGAPEAWRMGTLGRGKVGRHGRAGWGDRGGAASRSRALRSRNRAFHSPQQSAASAGVLLAEPIGGYGYRRGRRSWWKAAC